MLEINQIHNMDCLEGLKQLPDNSVDSIVTDPPYGISRELNCKNQRLGTTAKLNFNFGEWDEFDHKWFEIALQKSKGWVMTFCAKKDIGVYWDLLEKNKFVAIDCIAWTKPDPVPLNAKTKFLNAWEAIVIGKRPGAFFGSNYFHNILKYQAPKGKNRIHPTQKPLSLIKKLIELTTEKGDVVLDPFMGSGTTALACKQLRRRYIGFEIDSNYVEIAQKRLSQKVLFPLAETHEGGDDSE
jgi:DNA modification methylase